eukprot:m.1032816 g.1032816  ORF g.1032816 m.1032816 type:complete len:1024 (-) comp24128_c0_seq2:216-3287(-)
MMDANQPDQGALVAADNAGVLAGRPRRGAARRAVESIKDLVGSKPSIQYAPEEIAARRAVRDIRAQVKADYEALQNSNGRRGKKGISEDLPVDVQALRSCSELVSVSHFLTIFGKKFGIKPVTPDILEAEYQAADSLTINDMNARLLRKLLDRDDIIFSNWMEHFRGAYGEYEMEEDSDDDSEEEDADESDDVEEKEAAGEREENSTAGTISVSHADVESTEELKGTRAGQDDSDSKNASQNGGVNDSEQQQESSSSGASQDASGGNESLRRSPTDTVTSKAETAPEDSEKWVRRTSRRSRSTMPTEATEAASVDGAENGTPMRRTRRRSSSSSHSVSSTCPPTPTVEARSPVVRSAKEAKLSAVDDMDAGEALLRTDYADLSVVQRVSTTYLIQCWLVGEPVLRDVIDYETHSDDLRAEPIGKDAKNVVYYDFGDFRLYSETQSTKTKPSIWQTVCVTAVEWTDFVRSLKRTTNREEKKLYIYLDSILPNVLAELQRRDIEKLKETLGADVLVRASSRVRKNAAKAAEESKRKYMEEEEQRLQKILKQQSGSNVDDATSSGEESSSDEEDSDESRAKRAEGERQLREMRRIHRDNEIQRQKEEDDAKKKRADAVRAYRMAVREARKRGLPPPEMPAELQSEDQSAPPTASAVPKTKAQKQVEKSVVASTPPLDRNARARLARKINTPESKLKMFDFERFVGWYYGKRITQVKTGKRFFSSSMANTAAEALYSERTVQSLTEWHVYLDDARKLEQRARSRRAARERRQRKRQQERASGAHVDNPSASAVEKSTPMMVAPSTTAPAASATGAPTTQCFVNTTDGTVAGNIRALKRKFVSDTADTVLVSLDSRAEVDAGHRDKRITLNGETEGIGNGGGGGAVAATRAQAVGASHVARVSVGAAHASTTPQHVVSSRVPSVISPPSTGLSFEARRTQFVRQHGVLSTPLAGQRPTASDGVGDTGGALYSTPVHEAGANGNGAQPDDEVRQLTPMPLKPGVTPFAFIPTNTPGQTSAMNHLAILEE